MFARIINLDARTDRWNLMQAFVQTSKHKLERFSAIKIQSEDQCKPLLSLRAQADMGRERVQHEALHGKGAVGCALSHFLVWTEFLQSDASVCCVLEDDVNPKHAIEFDAAVERLSCKAWDIALLGWCGSLPPQRKAFDGDESLVVWPASRGFVGAHAYMLTRHAAQVLTQHFFPMEMQVDFAMQAIANAKGLCVLASDTKFRQTWTGSDVFTFCLLCEPKAVYAVIAMLFLGLIWMISNSRRR